MAFKMSNTPVCGSFRASKRLAIRGMSHLLTFGTILLRCECEGDVHSSWQLRKSCRDDVKNVESTNLELDILQMEGMLSIFCGIGILAGAK